MNCLWPTCRRCCHPVRLPGILSPLPQLTTRPHAVDGGFGKAESPSPINPPPPLIAPALRLLGGQLKAQNLRVLSSNIPYIHGSSCSASNRSACSLFVFFMLLVSLHFQSMWRSDPHLFTRDRSLIPTRPSYR